MGQSNVSLPPHPGEPCVHCARPIEMQDRYVGGKGGYWHAKCYSAESHLDKLAKELLQVQSGSAAADWDIAIRMKLDFAGVPAQVNESYGPGQAGRLAWFLDHTTYIIHELGIPDAYTEK